MEWFGSILIAPVFVAVIWPIFFAIIEVTSTILLSDRTVAHGEQKYRVSHIEHSGVIHSTAPVNVAHIVRLAERGRVIDITRLSDRRLDMFSFGLDLCIGALATDLSLAFAAATVNATAVRQLISLAVIHFLIYAFVMFLLSLSASRTRAVWSTNLMGVLSIVGSFIFVGGQIAQ